MSTTLITNAHLWSAGASLPGDSLLLSGGIIAALGTEAEVRRAHPRPETVIDARGCLVHPSFADAHVHAAFAGIERGRCDLSSAADAAETLELIARHADDSRRGWVLGSGWHMTHFPNGTPDRRDLDRIVPDRPVFLSNADHHSFWVNSAALDLAGITRSTSDPGDGRIERDDHGDPSGTLHEGAGALVAAFVPDTDDAEVAAGIANAQRVLLGYGVTAWQDPLVGEFGEYPDVAAGYASAISSGILRAGATGALWVPRDTTAETIGDLIADFRRRREVNRAAGFPTDTAKIMVDGTAENATALMSRDYCGHDHAGLAYFDPQVLNATVLALNTAGFAVHFHAIGDRAVTVALDAVTAVPHPHRQANHIAHVQVVHPADVPRFAALGVTVNAQALWACNEEQMTELTVPLLGAERTRWQYPFGSLTGAGATLAMGSDWPVSSPDPWQAIHVAVTRRPPGRPDAAPLECGESIPLSVALDAYTRQSHRLIGSVRAGVLEVGARGDVVIADRDPFAGDSARIHSTQVARLFLAGEEYRDSQAPS